MNKRSGKFYSKNEQEVMNELNLIPCKQSGAGWLEKEDGYNNEILAQLKSTDSNSYRFSLDDWYKLLYHANEQHKLPLFVLQFLEDNEQLLILRKEDLKAIACSLLNVKKLINDVEQSNFEIEPVNIGKEFNASNIKKCEQARNKFYEERRRKWQQKK